MVFSAGPGGQHFLSWGDLVVMLNVAMNTVYRSALQLLRLFVTPISEIIDNDTGISSWVTSLLGWVFDFFGIDLLSLTPLQFMLGTTLPTIIVFTFYRYVKQ